MTPVKLRTPLPRQGRQGPLSDRGHREGRWRKPPPQPLLVRGVRAYGRRAAQDFPASRGARRRPRARGPAPAARSRGSRTTAAARARMASQTGVNAISVALRIDICVRAIAFTHGHVHRKELRREELHSVRNTDAIEGTHEAGAAKDCSRGQAGFPAGRPRIRVANAHEHVSALARPTLNHPQWPGGESAPSSQAGGGIKQRVPRVPEEDRADGSVRQRPTIARSHARPGGSGIPNGQGRVDPFVDLQQFAGLEESFQRSAGKLAYVPA